MGGTSRRIYDFEVFAHDWVVVFKDVSTGDHIVIHNDNDALHAMFDEDSIKQYFQICADDDMKPSVAGLALAMNIDRRRLWEIREGKMGKNPAVSDTLKRTMQLLDLQMVDYMQNGKINPVSGIFLMKNNFGYADKQEVVLTPNNPLGDTKDTKALEEKYIDSVVDD